MTLAQIQERYRNIAASLGFDRSIPTVASETGSGVHAEFENDNFYYVLTECAECGHEPERQETCDPDEFLCWFIRDLTYELAINWADENRVPRKDHRRLWYRKHVEILHEINDHWANREAENYRECPRKYPYDDSEQDRINCMRKLQAQG